MFRDLRAQSLEAQSLLPVAALEKMRGPLCSEASALDSAVARLRRLPAYGALFGAAFAGAQPITAANVGKALACFERTPLVCMSSFSGCQNDDVRPNGGCTKKTTTTTTTSTGTGSGTAS